MSIQDLIDEAERMQRWGYADQLRAQAATEGVAVAAPTPNNAAPEGGDAAPSVAPPAAEQI